MSTSTPAPSQPVRAAPAPAQGPSVAVQLAGYVVLLAVVAGATVLATLGTIPAAPVLALFGVIVGAHGVIIAGQSTGPGRNG